MDYPELQNLIEFIKGDEQIMALYLIGSYGTPYQTPLSDIDFAVLSRKTLDYDQQYQLIEGFSSLLEINDVDVVFLNRAPLSLRYKVLEEGRLLYSRNRIFLSDFVEWTVKQYCDFAIDLKQFYQDYDGALLEEFSNGR